MFKSQVAEAQGDDYASINGLFRFEHEYPLRFCIESASEREMKSS